MSIGLTFENALELPIGLVFGLMNEKHNQTINNEDKKETEVIVGTADMLKGM